MREARRSAGSSETNCGRFPLHARQSLMFQHSSCPFTVKSNVVRRKTHSDSTLPDNPASLAAPIMRISRT